jgi:hypothetical protein
MTRQSSNIVLSKSVLQNINTHIKIDDVLNLIYREVSTEAQINKKNYKFDLLHPHRQGGFLKVYKNGIEEDPVIIITALMEALIKEFPDCKIERIKTYGYENKIVEHFIVIDWS